MLSSVPKGQGHQSIEHATDTGANTKKYDATAGATPDDYISNVAGCPMQYDTNKKGKARIPGSVKTSRKPLRPVCIPRIGTKGAVLMAVMLMLTQCQAANVVTPGETPIVLPLNTEFGLGRPRLSSIRDRHYGNVPSENQIMSHAIKKLRNWGHAKREAIGQTEQPDEVPSESEVLSVYQEEIMPTIENGEVKITRGEIEEICENSGGPSYTELLVELNKILNMPEIDHIRPESYDTAVGGLPSSIFLYADETDIAYKAIQLRQTKEFGGLKKLGLDIDYTKSIDAPQNKHLKQLLNIAEGSIKSCWKKGLDSREFYRRGEIDNMIGEIRERWLDDDDYDNWEHPGDRAEKWTKCDYLDYFKRNEANLTVKTGFKKYLKEYNFEDVESIVNEGFEKIESIDVKIRQIRLQFSGVKPTEGNPDFHLDVDQSTNEYATMLIMPHSPEIFAGGEHEYISKDMCTGEDGKEIPKLVVYNQALEEGSGVMFTDDVWHRVKVHGCTIDETLFDQAKNIYIAKEEQKKEREGLGVALQDLVAQIKEDNKIDEETKMWVTVKGNKKVSEFNRDELLQNLEEMRLLDSSEYYETLKRICGGRDPMVDKYRPNWLDIGRRMVLIIE